MSVEPGDRIDRYTIVDRLGAGGMGVVYRAYDARLERHVALKLLLGEQARDPSGAESDGRARMLREARAAAALEHPNVVAIYDVAEAESPEALRGTTYLAMELIDGRALRSYVGDASVPIERRVEWLGAVARALEAAHHRGLVHRDVKPGNVMVRIDGLVKVLDFGIAKRYATVIDPRAATEGAGATTTGGTIVGTPAYMAPEQLRKDRVDGRCDQFAWGVMAYELLSSKRPWRSEDDAMHLVAEILSFEPPALASVAPAVPAHVSATVMRALQKAPDARFADMGELLASLEGRAPVASATRNESPSGSERRPEPASRSAAVLQVPMPAPPAKRRPVAALVTSLLLGVSALTAAALVTRTARSPAPGTIDAASARATGAGRCTSNAACVDAHGGEAWTCRKDDGRCVALAAEGCEVLAEPSDLRDDATVWLGVLSSDRPTRNAADLARRDFASVPRAMLTNGRRRRPTALVSCDGGSDPRAAVGHMIDDVGTPAILGFLGAGPSIELISEVLVPQGVLALVTESTSSQITSIPSPPGTPRLVWRTTNDTTHMARALSAFVERVIEPRRRGARDVPFKVALVRPQTISGIGFSDALVSSLRLNDGGVADNQAAFAEHVLPLWFDAGDAAVARAREELLAMAPDVVFYFGDDLFASILRPLDEAWPARRTRPVYVSGLPFGGEALARAAEDKGLSRRLFAVTTPTNTPANAKFTLHYNATFPQRVTPGDAPNTTYDAFYVLAYALHALGDGPVDGAALAAQFEHLRGGPALEVGPARILDALGLLATGQSIDLVGAAGELDLDPRTGESEGDQVILCVASGDPPRAVESGLSWVAKTGALEGALRCP